MKENPSHNNSTRVYTRREFLRSSLVLTAGITFAACSDMSLSPINTGSPHSQVVVVGAGLSGLVAAYELSKAGYDVIVLEANNRIGGRVFTIRSPFAEGQFAEAGAARIPPNHNQTLNYVNEFGLQLDHFYPRTGDYIRYNNNIRNIISNSTYLANRPWSGSVTHGEYLKIRGGTDKLINAFAEHLAGKIILDSPVTMIDQTSEKIKVKIKNGNEVTADRVIVTVPLTVLNKIQFNPPLSSEKSAAANGGYNYASSTRVYLQTGERFWQNENLNGWGTTDWPEEMWQPTFDQNGDGGILMSYASRRRADELDQLSNDERIDSLVNRWTNIFPGLGTFVERGASHSWVRQEWSNGAYASPTYGQRNKYDPFLRLPEGKIHFAGEHISDYHGWMQGALASGLRVVNEIINTEVLV